MFQSTVVTALMLTVAFLLLEEKMSAVLTIIVAASGGVALLWFLQEIGLINMRDWLEFTNPEALRERRQSKERQGKALDAEACKGFLKERVIGQDAAIDALVHAIARGMRRKKRKKPILSALLVGPTGWGKTELAKGIAEFLFGNSKGAMLHIDVGNMDKHGVSSLVGSAPGFVGSDRWGRLTGHLHTTPKTVVLFDEVEKAGRDPSTKLYQMLLSLLDEGRVTDEAMGETVNADEALILMTSNAEAKKLDELAERYADEPEELERATKDALGTVWSQEFLGRIELILNVRPLGEEDLARVCVKHLFDLAEQHGLKLVEAAEAVDAGLLDLALDAAEPLKEYGVRAIVRWLDEKTSDAFAEAAENNAHEVRLVLEGENVLCEIQSYQEAPEA